jgi:hypothetical protein
VKDKLVLGACIAAGVMAACIPEAKADVTAERTADVLIAMDYLQTRNMLHRYDEGYHELNPILGSHPSVARLGTVCLGSVILVHNLPAKYQWAYVALEAVAVLHNRKIGLKMEF